MPLVLLVAAAGLFALVASLPYFELHFSVREAARRAKPAFPPALRITYLTLLVALPIALLVLANWDRPTQMVRVRYDDVIFGTIRAGTFCEDTPIFVSALGGGEAGEIFGPNDQPLSLAKADAVRPTLSDACSDRSRRRVAPAFYTFVALVLLGYLAVRYANRPAAQTRGALRRVELVEDRAGNARRLVREARGGVIHGEPGLSFAHRLASELRSELVVIQHQEQNALALSPELQRAIARAQDIIDDLASDAP